MSGYPLIAWLSVLLLAGVAGVWLLNRQIHASLAAPRVRESGVPDGLPWREVSIPTVRGKKLFGWFIPAGERAPALVILHGWGGNAEMMLPLARPLHTAGYALLFFDARSHGRSDGDTFASLPRFAEDLEHAVDWLRVQGEVDEQRVGVIGHSVGAGAALLLATRRHDLSAAVSLAAFAHPAGMMRRWLQFKRIPFWPLGAYILFYVQRVIGHRFDDIAPAHTISAVNCPVLLAHGTEDETVPVSEAEEIYANRKDGRVRLLLMQGSHDEYTEMERHIGTVIGFLDEAMRMERVKGIEPSYAAWEAAVLPLNYTRL
jgi:dipeptidyl aminopeptidase/acylaminoacyl peptidase